MPRSFAILATTGAAPVPVPPPIPAVINTISAPVSTSVRASLLSSAARVPTSGLAPAPIPLVAFSPIRILCVAVDFARAGLSELTATNSTSWILQCTIRLTAFPPPPPTPTTLICTTFESSVSIS